MAIPGQFWVSQSGSDSTGDGSPGNPYATIQKAYDEAVSWAEANFNTASRMWCGEVVLHAGPHDVGTGVVMDNIRAVTIRGAYRNAVTAFEGFNNPGATPVIHSTGNPSNGFFHVSDSGSGTGGFGFNFEGLRFYIDTTVNTAMLGAVFLERTSQSEWRDCHGFANNPTSQYLLYQTVVGGNDNSWWHWERLFLENIGAMYQDGTTNGNNYNLMEGVWHRDLIPSDSLDPVVSIGNGSSGLGEMKGSTLANVFSESNRVILEVDRALDCTFEDISGLSQTYTNPAIDLGGESIRNAVIGGKVHVNASPSTQGTYIRNAGSLVTLVPGLRNAGSAVATALKDEYLDNGGSVEHVLALEA